MNKYYETLGEVIRHLEEKYKENISNVSPIGYEQHGRIQGETFRAEIYRMHTGRYEVVDYKCCKAPFRPLSSHDLDINGECTGD